MGRKEKDRGASEVKSTAEGTLKKDARPREERVAKRGWSDVFDSLTYSDGPGDNIYVFG